MDCWCRRNTVLRRTLKACLLSPGNNAAIGWCVPCVERREACMPILQKQTTAKNESMHGQIAAQSRLTQPQVWMQQNPLYQGPVFHCLVWSMDQMLILKIKTRLRGKVKGSNRLEYWCIPRCPSLQLYEGSLLGLDTMSPKTVKRKAMCNCPIRACR